MMKRNIGILFLLLLVTQVSAQTDSRFDRFMKTLSDSCVFMNVEYVSGSFKGNSEICVQDKMYSMTGNGIEAICDGNTVCLKDDVAKEVVYEPVAETGGMSFLLNPALLFNDFEERFRFAKVEVESGVGRYELESKCECGIDKCTLWLDRDGKLVKAMFIIDGGNEMNVSVSEFKAGAKASPAAFALPDPDGFGKDWIITDLR